MAISLSERRVSNFLVSSLFSLRARASWRDRLVGFSDPCVGCSLSLGSWSPGKTIRALKYSRIVHRLWKSGLRFSANHLEMVVGFMSRRWAKLRMLPSSKIFACTLAMVSLNRVSIIYTVARQDKGY